MMNSDYDLEKPAVSGTDKMNDLHNDVEKSTKPSGSAFDETTDLYDDTDLEKSVNPSGIIGTAQTDDYDDADFEKLVKSSDIGAEETNDPHDLEKLVKSSGSVIEDTEDHDDLEKSVKSFGTRTEETEDPLDDDDAMVNKLLKSPGRGTEETDRALEECPTKNGRSSTANTTTAPWWCTRRALGIVGLVTIIVVAAVVGVMLSMSSPSDVPSENNLSSTSNAAPGESINSPGAMGGVATINSPEALGGVATINSPAALNQPGPSTPYSPPEPTAAPTISSPTSAPTMGECDGVPHSYSPNNDSVPEYAGSGRGSTWCAGDGGSMVCKRPHAASYSEFATYNGTTSMWFQATASDPSMELYKCSVSPVNRQVLHRVSLLVPPHVTYALNVYMHNSSYFYNSSIPDESLPRQNASLIDVEIADSLFGYDYWVQVEYLFGSSCEPWFLEFEKFSTAC